ncbi:type II toxin-antitoxin system VapC family toxin [Candidatus Pacearchaeota archaeon]|nr:type II toxin-antitoxin system VapC family toxin [Candidatus Pacearchaeota archaeon]
MYCLDTNIVIDIFRGDEKLKDKINDIRGSENIFISSITLCELYKGAFSFFKPEEKIKDIDNFIVNFQIIDLDKEVCKEYGKIHSGLKKRGNLFNDFDLIIAAIVKSNDLTLITRDNHFNNIDINMEIW